MTELNRFGGWNVTHIPTTTPQIFVLAGPNGAGKSTIAKALLPQALGVSQFVNADLIAQGLSPFAPYSVNFAAAEIMLRRLHELLQRRETLGFETTRASRSYASLLKRARQDGYLVTIIYIWLSSVELAISRVHARVQQDGHDVPASIIERRYHRSLANFFTMYRPLVDSWTLCDNSGEELLVVAQGVAGHEAQVFGDARYQQILRRAAQ